MSRAIRERKYNLYLEFIFFIACLLILFLTSININKFNSPKKVLGVESINNDSSQEFWNDFLSKNPTYIPGWIEIGNLDKVKEIDPNYLKP